MMIDRILFEMDADFSHDPGHLPRFLQAIDDADQMRIYGWLVTVVALTMAFTGCSPDGNAGEDAEIPAARATVTATGGSRPTVALNSASGRGYVAWVGHDGSEYNVYLSSAEAGSTEFSGAVRVNDIPGDASAHDQAPAQVAVGPEGEIYVLWQNNTHIEGRRFPASDLRLAVSADGGKTFSPAVTVNDDADGHPSSHTFHNLAAAGDGTVVVSWIDSREQDRLRREAAAAGQHSRMAEMSDGPEIRVARSWDRGETFSTSIVVDTDSCPCCRTALAVGADGSVYLAWRKHFGDDVRDIVVARAGPGEAGFAEPVRVHHDGWVYPGCPHAGPAIETDAEGRVHVAWYTGQDDRQGLWYAVSDDEGRSFATPAAILVDDWVPPSTAALMHSTAGMVLAWEDWTTEPTAIFLARPTPTSTPASWRGAPPRVPSAAATEVAGADLLATSGPNAIHAKVRIGNGRLPALRGSGGNGLLAWVDGEAVHAAWVNRLTPEGRREKGEE